MIDQSRSGLTISRKMAMPSVRPPAVRKRKIVDRIAALFVYWNIERLLLPPRARRVEGPDCRLAGEGWGGVGWVATPVPQFVSARTAGNSAL